MPEVGVRELKTRASEILRDVRDKHARYLITYRGRPVGVLLPIQDAEGQEAAQRDAWDRLEAIGRAIGSGWTSPLTSEQILREIRR